MLSCGNRRGACKLKIWPWAGEAGINMAGAV